MSVYVNRGGVATQSQGSGSSDAFTRLLTKPNPESPPPPSFESGNPEGTPEEQSPRITISIPLEKVLTELALSKSQATGYISILGQLDVSFNTGLTQEQLTSIQEKVSTQFVNRLRQLRATTEVGQLTKKDIMSALEAAIENAGIAITIQDVKVTGSIPRSILASVEKAQSLVSDLTAGISNWLGIPAGSGGNELKWSFRPILLQSSQSGTNQNGLSINVSGSRFTVFLQVVETPNGVGSSFWRHLEPRVGVEIHY